MKELYVVYFESANYAGYGEHCLVWAESEDEARYNEAVSEYAEDYYRVQDAEQWFEEHGDDEEDSWASIMWARLVVGSEYERYVAEQPELYPILN